MNGLEKLLIVLTRPAQELESVLYALYTDRTVERAIGTQLDVIGRIVGQPRNGMVNDDYRRYIRARIVANRSNGTIEDLILISRLILNDDSASVVVEYSGPASVIVRIEDVAVDDEIAEVLIGFLRKAKAAGVRLVLQSSAVAPVDWLQFDVDTWDDHYWIDARE